MKAKVHLIGRKASTPQEQDLITAFKRVGRDQELSSARSIFVKVNLCAGTAMGPSTGINVAVEEARDALRAIRFFNPDGLIFLAESDSVGFGFAYDKFRHCGYEQLLAEFSNLKLFDITRSPHGHTSSPSNGPYGDLLLPLAATQADFVVSLAKIKTHNIVGVSGAMKNHFGTMPDQFKNKFHPWLDRVITDVNQLVPTHLSILDGNPAHEGNGPVRGTPVQLGLTIVGNNPVATDHIMASIMGFPPDKIAYLEDAHRREIGPNRIDDIAVSGVEIGSVRHSFRFISTKKRMIMRTSLRIQGLGTSIQQAGHLLHLLDAASDLRRVIRYIRRRRASHRSKP